MLNMSKEDEERERRVRAVELSQGEFEAMQKIDLPDDVRATHAKFYKVIREKWWNRESLENMIDEISEFNTEMLKSPETVPYKFPGREIAVMMDLMIELYDAKQVNPATQLDAGRAANIVRMIIKKQGFTVRDLIPLHAAPFIQEKIVDICPDSEEGREIVAPLTDMCRQIEAPRSDDGSGSGSGSRSGRSGSSPTRSRSRDTPPNAANTCSAKKLASKEKRPPVTDSSRFPGRFHL